MIEFLIKCTQPLDQRLCERVKCGQAPSPRPAFMCIPTFSEDATVRHCQHCDRSVQIFVSLELIGDLLFRHQDEFPEALRNAIEHFGAALMRRSQMQHASFETRRRVQFTTEYEYTLEPESIERILLDAHTNQSATCVVVLVGDVDYKEIWCTSDDEPLAPTALYRRVL